MPFEMSRPAGFSVADTGLALMSRMWTGFQPRSATFLIGKLVGHLADDHGRGLFAEAGLQSGNVVAAKVIVLVEDADFGVGVIFQNVLRVNAAFGLVVGIERDGPGRVLRIRETRCSGGSQELRHLPGIEVFLNGRVRGRADNLEGEQDLVAFDEFAHLLDRFRRTVGVVVLNEVEFTAVDAALLVDHPEIGGLGLSDARIGRCRPAERHGLADLDLGIGCAGVVIFLRRGRRY
jgi:hypothetical protein